MPRSPQTSSQAPRRVIRSTGFQGRIAEVDLRLLRVFTTVAEQGGFAAAEIMLGKSKSSISIDISSLEKRLNLSLCQRGRGGFCLTPEGQGVLDATRTLFRDIDGFRQRLNQVSGHLSGRFCLYLTDNIQIHGETVLVRALSCFTSRHPDVYMEVRSASTRDVEFAVLNGTATAGLTLYPPDRPGMQTTALFNERSRLYCGHRHPLFGCAEANITPEILAAARMIEVSDASSSPRWDEIRDTVNFCATAENVDSRALLILSGSYLGFLPELFARQMVSENKLRHVDFSDLHLTNTFHLLVRPTPENGLLAETFRAILEEVC
ncbi:LysR family transcriptional regulator [Acetobacter oeni]|uniref:LysR family transcriptional regulator n=1 Tax=Acetobacter oeni TaxID=304077 RepID=A0A511XHH3_9PROT|nr:LysR family transcriptional regulator [Acetobacter oeni]MBB3881241.1 DNA-binding transcriptional LysR family regulator [Acetobacter oeni]GBR08250.1 LysR family transcriptional regulator [Acetobacter oeni LMG 21952]GEN62393.1 LysR family transcriptional regulator [Acetobacter oeni]